MTIDAAHACRFRFVEVMLRRIVLLREMALQTDTILFCAKLEAERFVAIAAGYTGMEHPALDERAVIALVNLPAPRMASRAHLDFSL